MSDSSHEPVSVSHDPETDSYRATFDSTTIAPSIAVAEVVARVRDTEPTQLDPLDEEVDSQALDRLCAKQTHGRREGDRLVEFTYLDQRVRVKSYGIIEVRPLASRDRGAED